ncbi:MAG: cytidylate kinase-like family protein [Solirubrobacteraceae bacterium]
MPVVTISASYGAGGSRIGPAVAERLGSRFVDRAIPVEVAARLDVDVDEARAHDGRAAAGLIGLLARMPNLSGVVLPEVENPLFQRETERLINEAADDGKVVVLGRAAAIVLRDRPGALHVRLDGREEERIRQAMHIEEVDRAEAARRLKDADAARTAYVKHFYGCDARSPEHYHLVLDTPALGLETCVELIVAAAAAREATARGTAAPAPRAPRAAPPGSS